MPMEDILPDFRTEAGEHELPRRRSSAAAALVFAVVVAAAVFGWFWWTREAPPAPPGVVTVAPPDDTPAPAPPVAEPAVKYPVEDQDGKPLTAAEIPASLAGLVGRTAAATHLQTDQFPRRLVATIDNLARSHAPPAVWPVMPTNGRFTVAEGPGGAVIAPGNAQRYAPFVAMATSVDAQRAARLYRRMYPLLLQAYRELGYDRYLNDRVVEVIDLLLATPEPAAPPQVRLTEVKGPIPSVRPWVRYQFVDPALEELTAGQKILVRVGPEHARRLKKKLVEFRAQLVQPRPDAAPR